MEFHWYNTIQFFIWNREYLHEYFFFIIVAINCSNLSPEEAEILKRFLCHVILMTKKQWNRALFFYFHFYYNIILFSLSILLNILNLAFWLSSSFHWYLDTFLYIPFLRFTYLQYFRRKPFWTWKVYDCRIMIAFKPWFKLVQTILYKLLIVRPCLKLLFKKKNFIPSSWASKKRKFKFEAADMSRCTLNWFWFYVSLLSNE